MPGCGENRAEAGTVLQRKPFGQGDAAFPGAVEGQPGRGQAAVLSPWTLERAVVCGLQATEARKLFPIPRPSALTRTLTF